MQLNYFPDSSPLLQNPSQNLLKRVRNKQEDQDQDQDQEQEQKDLQDRTRRQQKKRCRVLSGLEIPAPVRISLPLEEYSGKAEESFQTPKSTDLRRDLEARVEVKNPSTFCPPPAPRKPKAAPATKRRAIWVRSSVILLDVSREVESMFPPPVLGDFGKKIKKARS